MSHNVWRLVEEAAKLALSIQNIYIVTLYTFKNRGSRARNLPCVSNSNRPLQGLGAAKQHTTKALALRASEGASEGYLLCKHHKGRRL